MTISLSDLDAHEQPSPELRAEWKSFQKLTFDSLEQDPRIDDPRADLSLSGFRPVGTIPTPHLHAAFQHLGLSPDDYSLPVRQDDEHSEREGAPIIHHPLLPGLLIMPSLLPAPVQSRLTDLMVHRDLSNPKHMTNMHLHFNLPYPEPEGTSFFTLPAEDTDERGFFTPKEPSVHKPQPAPRVLNKKLHWVTLGGQYDWTNRNYPEDDALQPRFPQDIASFLDTLWPETRPEAAIVNFYSPGDSMMIHRDVSEETDRGLVSISIGCDGLFMIAPSKGPDGRLPPTEGVSDKDGKGYLMLRLRSGDAIYMTEESRYAWHGVPKVVTDTCPDFLEDWPATEAGDYEAWRGWMRNKRINLNVRQMKD